MERLACVEDARRLAAAIDSLAHRGPDDRGLYVAGDGRAFLGHRRLSIIDLSGGHQPIADESALRHFCYNGEIYNFRALREALTARGHRFRTLTDGETALHLYEEDPRGFVGPLRGMFAIAILDEEAQRLTLVRDRNGIKPLYYAQDGRTLYFGSELKAVLALLPARPAISAHALHEYLRWKFVPAPLTIYEGVCELPAGHLLVARRDAGGRLEVEIERYWEPDYGSAKLTDEHEALEMLDGLLRSAVESHLEADVEVGALLSGGVDSSLVVALASRLSGRRIKTFTVGFREEGFDQLPAARVLARAYDTEHYEEYVDLDPMTAVPRLVRFFDQPFADSSALACYRVCEVAGRHVKVALTGDGGDETFAGYRRYADLWRDGRRDTVVRRFARGALFAAGAAVFSPEAKFLNRIRGGFGPPLRHYEEREVMCGRGLIDRLLTEPYRHAAGPDAFGEHLRAALSRGWSAVDAAQYVDSRMYLPGDILTKVDRTSMAWSLECRVPLLDHTISEFAARLPLEWKIRQGVPKYLLKRLAERYVPRELLYRKKRGFRVPIRRWFKGGLLEETGRLLRDGELAARGILDPAGIRWLLGQQRRAWINLYSALWALLFMEHWARSANPGDA
ncbi:MAG: asparagine synthase (glutamine-hydrolyzing) [Phycisphaerae bacterium]